MESGEFAETQVQHPPDQNSSFPPCIPFECSLRPFLGEGFGVRCLLKTVLDLS